MLVYQRVCHDISVDFFTMSDPRYFLALPSASTSRMSDSHHVATKILHTPYVYPLVMSKYLLKMAIYSGFPIENGDFP